MNAMSTLNSNTLSYLAASPSSPSLGRERQGQLLMHAFSMQREIYDFLYAVCSDKHQLKRDKIEIFHQSGKNKSRNSARQKIKRTKTTNKKYNNQQNFELHELPWELHNQQKQQQTN